MSSLIKAAAILVIAAMAQGCATGFPNGLIHTGVKLPVCHSDPDGKVKDFNVGVSECYKVLSLWAWGDASIDTAMKNGQAGQIKRVQRVEYEANDWFGCGTFKTIVYGE